MQINFQQHLTKRSLDMSKSKISGFVFYRGPSMLDSAPIVAILTGLKKASRNTKTGGDLLQTWILRADQSPIQAIHSGADSSICGACPHRGILKRLKGKLRNSGRSCYVTVFQAPLVVWKAFKRGIYPQVTPQQASELVADRMVRLGAYGDPAAIPFHVWQTMLARVSGKAGYTHQWAKFPELAEYCMASCDNESDYATAKILGFRSFRVRRSTDPVLPREVVCPASKEAGNKTSCDACKACGGTSAKARADIVIAAHGARGKINAFTNRAA
jgi:hypothetical protein